MHIIYVVYIFELQNTIPSMYADFAQHNAWMGANDPIRCIFVDCTILYFDVD